MEWYEYKERRTQENRPATTDVAAFSWLSTELTTKETSQESWGIKESRERTWHNKEELSEFLLGQQRSWS